MAYEIHTPNQPDQTQTDRCGRIGINLAFDAKSVIRNCPIHSTHLGKSHIW